jgi:hypothetical protein
MFAVVSEIAGQHQKSFKESQSTRSTRAIMNPKSQLGRNVKEQCLIKSTKDKKKSSTWEDVQLTDGKV